jgi:ABC-type Fe3+-citrate transport system substrate-binding protein
MVRSITTSQKQIRDLQDVAAALKKEKEEHERLECNDKKESEVNKAIQLETEKWTKANDVIQTEGTVTKE